MSDSNCKHTYYKQGFHTTLEKANAYLKRGDICWIGKVVTECRDCGADLSEHRIVPVQRSTEYIKDLALSKK